MKSFRLFAALVAALFVAALSGSPALAGCPAGVQQPYAAPAVQYQAYPAQALAVPVALFVVPSAPTVQLNVQGYGYAAPAAVVQKVVQPVVVQKQVGQKAQQDPPRRPRLFRR